MRRLAGIYQNFLRVAVASRKGSDCVGSPLRPARRVMMTWFVVVTACNAAFARTLEVWSVPRHSVLSTSISCPISRFPPSSSFPFSLRLRHSPPLHLKDDAVAQSGRETRRNCAIKRRCRDLVLFPNGFPFLLFPSSPLFPTKHSSGERPIHCRIARKIIVALALRLHVIVLPSFWLCFLFLPQASFHQTDMIDDCVIALE